MALAVLSREHVQDTELMMAGAVVTVLPVLLLFLALQRYYMQGLLVGSVKEMMAVGRWLCRVVADACLAQPARCRTVLDDFREPAAWRAVGLGPGARGAARRAPTAACASTTTSPASPATR